MNILVPVDGSDNSGRAVRFAISLYEQLAPFGITLLHVQVRPALIDKGPERADSAPEALDPGVEALCLADRLLDLADIKYVSELRPDRGYIPGVIADYARDAGCAAIVMGTRGLGSTGDVLGSIARQVVAHAGVPVTLVK